jgi:Fe-S-cluster-containing hydrogenase component 2
MKVEIREYCCYCGTCSNVCPQNAIELLDRGIVEVDYNTCTGCGLCVKVCPIGAINGL